MNESKKIIIKDIITSNLCISAEDGQKVFDILASLLKEGEHVVISFEGIDVLISLFLNVAIGQLYGEFSQEQIRKQLEVEGLAPDDLQMLQYVVENAKKYYANSEAYDAARKEEDDED